MGLSIHLLEFVLILAIILDVLVDVQSRRNSNVGVRSGFREVIFAFSVILLSWVQLDSCSHEALQFSKGQAYERAGAIAFLLFHRF